MSELHRHVVTDAHGRSLDLTANGQAPQVSSEPRTNHRRQRVSAGLAIAAVLAAGLVLSVLLIVIRDIVTTLAGGSVTGLVLRALLTPSSNRREK